MKYYWQLINIHIILILFFNFGCEQKEVSDSKRIETDLMAEQLAKNEILNDFEDMLLKGKVDEYDTNLISGYNITYSKGEESDSHFFLFTNSEYSDVGIFISKGNSILITDGKYLTLDKLEQFMLQNELTWDDLIRIFNHYFKLKHNK